MCVQAPDREVYTRDTLVFPLADVAEKDLDRFSDDRFSDLSMFDLNPQSPLPILFVEDSLEIKKAKESVYHFW